MTNERNQILVAGDDEAMRELSIEIIKERFPGFPIESFGDGTSLEGRLNQNTDNVRLVVTDNQMLGLSGGQLIRKYATKPEFFGVRFILCYGGQNDIGERALKEGAYAFLKKPYHIDVYTELIRKAIEE